MDTVRSLTLLCLLLVTVLLVFSFGGLITLRSALRDTKQLQENAEGVIEDLNELKKNESAAPETSDGNIPVDVLYDAFYVRNSGGRVAIYTDGGELIRVLDIAVSTLPSSDQAALQNGIELHSWKEVLALIADFGG